MPSRYCACGGQIGPDSRFCPRCGRRTSGSSRKGGLLTLSIVFGLAIVGVVIQSQTQQAPDALNENNHRELQESPDPPPPIPLTPQQHLEVAKRLLGEVNVDQYDRADILIRLVSEHLNAAQKEPQTKPQVDFLMKRMTSKALDVVRMKAWSSQVTADMAEILCKHTIESHLKAPSTADWFHASTARWRNHPGYFLSTQTVDAQNSFGAKLRVSYECRVMCLSAKACEVEKLQEVEP